VRAGAAREGSGALGRALGTLLPAGRSGGGGELHAGAGPGRGSPRGEPRAGEGKGMETEPPGTGTSGLWAERGKAELLLSVLPFPLLPSPLPVPR